MRYEKPTVKDLSGCAARGQSPLACLGGTSVIGFLCDTGGNDAACSAGTDGAIFSGQDCTPGGTATGNFSCLPGGIAGWECAGGSSASATGPCTVGPSA